MYKLLGGFKDIDLNSFPKNPEDHYLKINILVLHFGSLCGHSTIIQQGAKLVYSSQVCSLRLVHVKWQSGIRSGVNEPLRNHNGVEQKKDA